MLRDTASDQLVSGELTLYKLHLVLVTIVITSAIGLAFGKKFTDEEAIAVSVGI